MKLCSQIGVIFVLLMVAGCVSKDIPTVTDPAVNTSDEAVKGDDTSNATPTRSGKQDTDTTADSGKVTIGSFHRKRLLKNSCTRQCQ